MPVSVVPELAVSFEITVRRRIGMDVVEDAHFVVNAGKAGFTEMW